MRGRYQLRHPRYGFGLKFSDLARARRELVLSVPAGEWFIFDRLTKERI